MTFASLTWVPSDSVLHRYSETSSTPAPLTLQQKVAALEYQPSPQAGVLAAPNRAQGLRLRWAADGVEVEARDQKQLLAKLQTVGFGRTEDWQTCGDAVASADKERVVRRWPGLTEWWHNSAEGAEEGWTITERPGGEGPLSIRVQVTAAKVTSAGDSLRFSAQTGQELDYGQITAFDSRGTRLSARVAAEGSGFAVEVDDGAAFYPVTVDPLLTSAGWSTESDQATAYFGYSVASAGDVNGDGFSDVIVGASDFDNGETDEGRAFVYLGSALGLAPTPAWTAESNQASAFLGVGVAGAGDVNGDGFSDVIVGAYRFDNGETDEGRIFVYHGSASGLAATPAWTAESNQASATLGRTVASAGDVNGDGFSDVIAGAIYFDNGQTDEGRAFLYLGSASGLSPAPAWTAESNQANANFGFNVASAGDVNGDGFSDVVVGALYFDNGQNDEGRAFLYLGSASGLSATPAWTAESNQVSAYFGYGLASAGDVNGDGFSDVIVGAEAFDNGQMNEGRAFLYLGSASGLAATPAWTGESNQATASFGWSVACAGDVNGDGFSDVVVGAYQFDNGETNEGRAFLYLGSASGLAANPAWTAESNQAGAFFGYGGTSAGDVNGDGFSDVIVGTVYYDNGQTDEGRAFVYLGNASGLTVSAAWTAESNQALAELGVSVASAGDVNGDGFSDIIIGAHLFDNGESDEGRAFLYLGSASGLATAPAWTAEANQTSAKFGRSVASAGDVNGDGFSDVIVGASDFDNGEPDEGRAFLYLGSASGLATTPAWTAEGNQANARLGHSLASAGDVNGDGFSDVIVGALEFDNGETDEGRAFLYLGTASGLAPTPAWTAEANQANARLGYSLASAGDVNGDGFSDVIVGAPYLDNGSADEGRAFLYLGSIFGLATSPVWTAESNQLYGWFGFSVASAGDVNGDGFSDVMIGAPSVDFPGATEGRVSVYLGSGSGLPPTPAWTAEANQALAFFGGSVASAGDVNGDGFSDVVIGARLFDNSETDEGRAFLYLGGASGVATTPAWTIEPNQAQAELGVSVASAGDVNGDGFSDVIVGAFRLDNGQTDEGRALLSLGGDNAPGASRQLQQKFGGPAAGAGVRAVAQPAFEGRVTDTLATSTPRHRIQAEVKPVGIAFSGTNLIASPLTPAGVSATALPPPLSPGRYHWRARVVSGAGRGRWASFGGNSESEADFVVLGSVDAGTADAGTADSGSVDAGPTDAGSTDAGSTDAGSTDAGTDDTRPIALTVGCGCRHVNNIALFALGLALFWSARRPRRSHQLE